MNNYNPSSLSSNILNKSNYKFIRENKRHHQTQINFLIPENEVKISSPNKLNKFKNLHFNSTKEDDVFFPSTTKHKDGTTTIDFFSLKKKAPTKESNFNKLILKSPEKKMSKQRKDYKIKLNTISPLKREEKSSQALTQNLLNINYSRKIENLNSNLNSNEPVKTNVMKYKEFKPSKTNEILNQVNRKLNNNTNNEISISRFNENVHNSYNGMNNKRESLPLPTKLVFNKNNKDSYTEQMFFRSELQDSIKNSKNNNTHSTNNDSFPNNFNNRNSNQSKNVQSTFKINALNFNNNYNVYNKKGVETQRYSNNFFSNPTFILKENKTDFHDDLKRFDFLNKKESNKFQIFHQQKLMKRRLSRKSREISKATSKKQSKLNSKSKNPSRKPSNEKKDKENQLHLQKSKSKQKKY